MERMLTYWKHIVMVVILGVLALLIIDFNSRMADWRRLSLHKAAVSAEVAALEHTQAALKTQIAHATSPAGVVEWAYEDGNMVRPGDVLVVPMDPEERAPTPTPVPLPTPQIVTNWQLWFSLFFDP